MKNDLISRKAAIEALGERPLVWTDDDQYTLGERNQYDIDRLAIETLPSAEVTLCYLGSPCEYQNADIAMPTIDPVKWIPVTERLPEDLEEVNVTWVNHDPEPYYNFVKDKPFTATAVYYKGKWYWYSVSCVDLLGEYGRNFSDEIDDGIEIIAWLPLPEPWKGEEDE